MKNATMALLPIQQILPNPLQPRKTFDADKLQELADSVKAHGVVQPVVVTKAPEGYRLVVGERRWRAAQAAGLTHIPAVVQSYAEVEAMQVALVENLQRDDLNPIEEAQAIAFLLREYHMTQDELASRLGRSRPAVSNLLRLLQLPTEIQSDVAAGVLTAGHARALLSLEDDTTRLRTWKRVRELQLSVRQTEQLVKRLQEQPAARPERTVSEELEDLLTDLERSLQAPVKIRQSARRGGRIEITYTCGEELERLVDLLQRATPRPRRPDFEWL